MSISAWNFWKNFEFFPPIIHKLERRLLSCIRMIFRSISFADRITARDEWEALGGTRGTGKESGTLEVPPVPSAEFATCYSKKER